MATNKAESKEMTTEEKERLAAKRQRAYLQERVPVMLQRPEGEKMAHRTITVNGKNFQIQYGVTVMVPRYVKNVIDESVRNAEEAQRRADEITQK